MAPLLPAPRFIGKLGLGAGFTTGDHRPPPLIQDERALPKVLSHATRLRYLLHAMHAAYEAKDKCEMWEE